jgi:hypothetical protein
MTQALRTKQSNRELGQAGWILDYWVASFDRSGGARHTSTREASRQDAGRQPDLRCIHA